MNKLLAIFILCAGTSSWADAYKEYSFESASCSTGAELSPQTSLLLEAEFDLIQLSKDNTKLEMEQKVEGKLQKLSFKLNQVGKSSYMALPVVITSEMNQFFVKIDEDRSEVEISRNDFMAKHCGGGLIIKTFSVESQKTP
ncbi:MAG: hypothetical protein IT287_06300 [Bdellovibrionaceae bacterium]|nr:hypothetical protein [Pseudobdellovibrionaceae bacterium]